MTPPPVPPTSVAQAAPLADALDSFLGAGIAHFSPPGHKRRPTLSGRVDLGQDLTLLGGLEDLQLTGRLRGRAQDEAARLWGAAHTRFTTQGTTHLNLATALTVSRPGEPVIVARSSHRSVVAGLVLSGALPVWLWPEVVEPAGVAASVRPRMVADALDAAPDATAVWIADPTYLGLLADIEAIAEVARPMPGRR